MRVRNGMAGSFAGPGILGVLHGGKVSGSPARLLDVFVPPQERLPRRGRCELTEQITPVTEKEEALILFDDVLFDF